MYHHCRFGVAFAAICLWPAASIAADAIKIGFPIPLSGPTSVYGKPVLPGAEMAVAEINGKGGVLGKSSKFYRAMARPMPMSPCGCRAS